jgi:hypothetical protein
VQNNHIETGPLSVGSTYYIRVRSVNKAGSGAWSASKRFKTVASNQPEVFLISPGDSVIINDRNINFSWKSSHNADHYYLQVATDSLMKNTILSDSTIISSNRSQTISSNKSTLWWQVKAHYRSGWGRWSPKRQLTIIDTILKLNFNVKHLHNKSKSIKIDLNLPVSSIVKIKLYSINGLLLSYINYNRQKTGSHSFTIKNGPKTSGYYIMKLEAGPFSAIRRFQMYD